MQTQAPHPHCDDGKRKVIRRVRRRGFALIVVLTLMMLLAVLALGFLGLSTITLRSSGAEEASYQARANARLALMLAIGELQKTAGTDKAVTANSEIISETPSKKNLTGSWKSWDFDPTSGSAPNYASEKRNRFQGWLVSNADPEATKDQNFATTPFTGDTLELVGDGSVGKNAPDSEKAVAGLVSITRNGRADGSYAWHVSDEAVKARIGTYRDPSQNGTLAKRRALLSGQRAEVSVIKSRDNTALDFLPTDENQNKYDKAKESSGKLVNLSQTDLFAQTPQISGKFRNSITPYSLGLLTNTRTGGLKKDLSSMFETTNLPNEYSGKRLYQSTNTLSTNSLSDPNWSTLRSYYNLRTSIKNPETAPTFSAAPKEDIDIKATTPSAPTEMYPGPVITKLDILFSLVLRDAHANWATSIPAAKPPTPADAQRRYLMHMVYAPLITLHNPYNVNIEFDRMRVIIRNPPIGFNFYVDDKPQNTRMVGMGEMFVGGARGEKSFAFDIANWKNASLTDRGVSGPLQMKPGQTLVCSPYIEPGQTFNGNASETIFFDYNNNLTGVDKDGNIVADAKVPKAKPGFNGKSVGYDLDFLTPFDTVDGNTTDGKEGVLGMRRDNRFRAEMSILQPAAGLRTEFQVAAFITSNNETRKYGGISFKYEDQATLQKNFPTVYKFPSNGTMTGENFYEPNGNPLVTQAKAQTIGVLSAYARTSNGGVYETQKRTTTNNSLNALNDGRIAGKPFIFSNSASPMEIFNMKTDVLGNAAREFNLQPLPGQIEDNFNVDNVNRTNILTSYQTNRGVKSGAYLELPTGPMQTIADFRRSNALSSPFPPSYVQPVANSWISPILATNVVSQQGQTGSPPLLDHSYLANRALYDGFFFSTVATDGSTQGDRVLKDFLDGTRPLPNQGYQPWIPKGETVNSISNKLYSGNKPSADAYKLMASALLVKGAFNVNSTNVQAWKAMLSSLKGADISIFWARTAALQGGQKATGIPILSMTLPVAGKSDRPLDANMDSPLANRWNGYRELSDSDIELLANQIVVQIRKRGPFLSLSEFVNRQIGPDSELTRTGALQAAITESRLNNAMFPESEYVPVTASDVSNPVLYNYKTPLAAVGSPGEGAPGWITQGDLMKVLEPGVTVRADTFVIRTCGQSLDAKGKVIARAYAEAVVQRVPEFVDSVDNATVNVYENTTGSQANKLFGRRFEIVSFRWLSNSEI